MPLDRSILIVVTSHGALGATGKSTGLWLDELVTPYWALRDAGAAVTVASPQGGPVPIDPGSRKAPGANPPAVERFLADPEAHRWLEGSLRLADLDLSRFHAVFFPGGHGTMWDFATDPTVAAAVSTFLESGRPVAAVCHGPAALVGALRADGTPVVAGRRVAAFTDAEEAAAGLVGTVPFLLSSRLAELGATLVSGPNWAPLSVRDGLLVTGQNPASAEAVARDLLAALEG